MAHPPFDDVIHVQGIADRLDRPTGGLQLTDGES